MKRILAADIGGTNGRFASFTYEGGTLALGEELWLDSAGASSFAELVAGLPDEGPLAAAGADAVSLAVAGPVQGGTYCDPPNLPWDVDVRDPARFGFRRAVMCNDFEAQAYAVPTDALRGAEVVHPGTPREGVVAVIGAGTGLGKAALAPDGHGGWVALPTEGGHALFPFEGAREFAFQEFVAARAGRTQVIGDMVLSGSGLAALHAFLTGEEATPERVGASLGPGSETLAWFARFYGRACRDLALSLLAVGGVVVTGGVAARNPAIVRHAAFSEEFLRSETHGRLVERIPVRLNVNERSGLWGAAYNGLKLLGAQ